MENQAAVASDLVNAIAGTECVADLDQDRRGEILKVLTKLGDAASPRHSECRFSNFEAPTVNQREAVAAALAWSDDPNCNLVLFGPCGTGKDHLAYAAVRKAVIQHGSSVRWVNGQDWFGEVRDAIDEDTSERATIRAMVAPDLLIISDPLPPFGNLTQHQATMLYRVINARCKPTVATINVANDDEADERLGVATWDRLCDGAVKICCKWQSYRRPARKVNC